MTLHQDKTYAVVTDGDWETILGEFQVALSCASPFYTGVESYNTDELSKTVWPYFVRSLRGKTFWTMELIIAEMNDYYDSDGDIWPAFTVGLVMSSIAMWANACAFDPDYSGLGRKALN